MHITKLTCKMLTKFKITFFIFSLESYQFMVTDIVVQCFVFKLKAIIMRPMIQTSLVVAASYIKTFMSEPHTHL